MGLAPEKASRIIAVSSKPLLLIPDLSPGGKRAQVRREIWDQSLMTVEINTITRVLRQA